MKLSLRFSLRALFIVMTIAIVIGGLEFTRQSAQSLAVSKLRQIQGCSVAYAHDVESSPEWEGHVPRLRSTVSSWVRNLTGVEFFCPAVRLWMSFDTKDPAAFREIAALRHLRWLHIDPSGLVPGDGLPCPSIDAISKCRRLEHLELGTRTRLSPNGSPLFLGTGKTLTPLHVNGEHLRVISELSSLRVLVIGGPGVSDGSLDSLANLRQLEYLYLHRTRLTEDGLARLRKLLQNVEIVEMNDRSRDYWAEIDSRF